MQKKIAIIANGTINDHDFHKKILKESDVLICADGGANIAKQLDIFPHYIIGDLDSIEPMVLDYFKKQGESKIIKDTNQDKTDLELAIDLAQTLNPSEIKIYAALGNRIDHTLANIYCLDKISGEISAEIVDEKTSIKMIKKGTEIKGEKNEIVSVIGLSNVSNLNYKGFKWNVKNLCTKPGWFGISNKMLSDKANIDFSEGKIIVIKVRR